MLIVHIARPFLIIGRRRPNEAEKHQRQHEGTHGRSIRGGQKNAPLTRSPSRNAHAEPLQREILAIIISSAPQISVSRSAANRADQFRGTEDLQQPEKIRAVTKSSGKAPHPFIRRNAPATNPSALALQSTAVNEETPATRGATRPQNQTTDAAERNTKQSIGAKRTSANLENQSIHRSEN